MSFSSPPPPEGKGKSGDIPPRQEAAVPGPPDPALPETLLG
jgi:hypothetical protein